MKTNENKNSINISYFKYMLDILKSKGNFVIKFVASTLKLYLRIAIIMEVAQNYSCIHFRSLNSV